jgi:hypothetical protein
LLLLAVIRLAHQFQLGWPFCAFRLATGLPCPTCGGTRSVLALVQWRLGEAFWWNPLVALGCIAMCAWFLLWLLDVVQGRARSRGVWECAQRRPWPVVLAGAVALNWVYLWFFLPR